MDTLSAKLAEIRARAEAHLSSTGSSMEVKVDAQAMANICLPLSTKYQRVPVETILKDNGTGNSRQECLDALQKLVAALHILEKYGCNLIDPKRPKYWRCVKHNNPVFRTIIDYIQGGRTVLCLFGYSIQKQDGLHFPDEVMDPDVEMVAAVTIEIMALHMELDMLVKNVHPHPEFFENIIPSLSQRGATREEEQKSGPSADTVATPDKGQLESGTQHQLQSARSPAGTPTAQTNNCTLCGLFPASAQCPTCVQQLCVDCDKLYHSHPDRRGHDRIRVAATPTTNNFSPSLIANNEPQAMQSKTGHLQSDAPAVLEDSQSSPVPEWQCQSCTMMNAALSVLCAVCERPRLATCPQTVAERPVSSSPGLLRNASTQWTCQACTYINSTSSTECEICNTPCTVPTPAAFKPLPQVVEPSPAKPRVLPVESPEVKRQRLMKEEGLELIHQIRTGEKRGLSPEEVYAAACVSRGSNVSPCDWLASELPHLLDEIGAMAATFQHALGTGSSVQLSRAEAKRAWLTAGGDTQKAVWHALLERRAKMRELSSLGFREAGKCEEALNLSGGDVQEALSHLQRPLLEQFRQRIWSESQKPKIDVHHPDKERVCRRLLALYNLPSWGRCCLAMSLLQKPDVPYSLEDVVQAVRDSNDLDFIQRVLAMECPCCLDNFPHNKMQSLTSCQCSVCCECFQQHFTVAVRDKHIRDMVCPVCAGPDINDPEHLNSYFSTLDVQLRECLELDVYQLFHTKLTEHTLMKDPMFRWCSECSFGFIYDGQNLKVTCPDCKKSFCSECRKTWEPQHADLSCEQFQRWKKENDPEYQKQGLAGYLRDNGITCPHCRFQYALTKGGCMHFTCSQCRHQFCSGCNNPFHTTACSVPHCALTGLHAHHPRDCLFYLRDWDSGRLKELLEKNDVEFNTELPEGAQAGQCGVMEQKEEGVQQLPCGKESADGQAGLCEKHYKEYLVSLVNDHSLDPALLLELNELLVTCRRYQVDSQRGEAEEDEAYGARLQKTLMEQVPLGDKVPRKK